MARPENIYIINLIQAEQVIFVYVGIYMLHIYIDTIQVYVTTINKNRGRDFEKKKRRDIWKALEIEKGRGKYNYNFKNN